MFWTSICHSHSFSLLQCCSSLDWQFIPLRHWRSTAFQVRAVIIFAERDDVFIREKLSLTLRIVWPLRIQWFQKVMFCICEENELLFSRSSAMMVLLCELQDPSIRCSSRGAGRSCQISNFFDFSPGLPIRLIIIPFWLKPFLISQRRQHPQPFGCLFDMISYSSSTSRSNLFVSIDCNSSTIQPAWSSRAQLLLRSHWRESFDTRRCHFDEQQHWRYVRLFVQQHHRSIAAFGESTQLRWWQRRS